MFSSMENATDTKSKVTLLGRETYQLQNTIFQHTTIRSAFLPVMNKSLHATFVFIIFFFKSKLFQGNFSVYNSLGQSSSHKFLVACLMRKYVLRTVFT